ncbi:MAG: type VI secretion system lipoprotein TssJ [Gammaproteobacteria bacterium]|nr:type VI secretion system lipoprotein TssJ [Gammaproteobacteria bacterium]
MKSNLIIKLALVLILPYFSACSSLNSAVGGIFGADTDLTLSFKVESDINPDENKTPSPLFIRMYELKSPKLFKNANFIDIYEQDKERLGEDFIAVQKLKRLKPGEDRENSFVLSEKTQFVGLYAEFLDYKNAGYKLIIPVVQHDVIGTTVNIKISGNKIINADKMASK